LADGKIQIVNLEAKTFSLKAEPKLDANPRLVYAQLAGDSRKDYLRYKNGWADLHFYDDKNKYTKIFSRELEGKPADIFEVFTPNSLYSQIGGLSPQQERIYLYDENGELRKGFPLVGTTRFQVVDFLGDRSEMLLVGNKNTLLAYKIGK
jgi:hypothetical protein